MEEVPCIISDDLTEAQVKAFRIADNKVSEFAVWDEELLQLEMEQLADMDFDLSFTGFDMDELEALLETEEEVDVKEDEYEVELPEEPKAKLGDIYQLGRHRLMCGDSTSQEDVARLMNGNKADLLVTDPPYNVAYQGGTDEQLTIMNDSMGNDEFKAFLVNAFQCSYDSLKEGASFYVWYASREHINFESALNEVGLQVRQQLIWNKNALVLGRQDYHWKHEPCLYGWKEGKTHNWYSDRGQTTVLDFDKPNRNGEHPTMKPLDLIGYQIGNSSKRSDIVLDVFGGSGSTLMACEQLGRTCYTMELDPKYVDVIIERYETFTGEKAEKLNVEVA